MDGALEAHFATADVLARRADLVAVGVIDYALRRREIEAVLPGVYARAHHKAHPEVRIAALRRYEPNAVLLGEAAARLAFWPALDVETVVAAVTRKLAPQAGFRFVRRTVPADWVTEIGGTKVAKPALAALEAGPDVIDHALREGAITLAEVARAYEATVRWKGHDSRRRLVEESSGNPWSAAERKLHRMLRDAGLTSWQGNYPVGDHPVDVAFVAQRLAIEIDGRHFHGDATFEKDRWQQNALVLAGWRVLRFTWTMIEEYPERVLATVRTALAQ
ncbi:MAG TPA: DUF559 domain-containing protein [Microlunatus sp.]